MERMIICGDSLTELKKMENGSIDCCVTSPPYWGLRDYQTATWEGGSKNCSHKRDSKKSGAGETGSDNVTGGIGDGIYKDICLHCGAKRIDAQLGLEKTPEDYVAMMVEIFREVKRVLKKEGTLWLNLGDSYAGSGKGHSDKINYACVVGGVTASYTDKILKPKDIVGIPWRVAFALRTDGWYLRQDIIWHKPNPMPESVTDRCTKAHEYIFLMSKSARYYFDGEAIKEKTTSNRPDMAIKGVRTGLAYLSQEKIASNSLKPHKTAITPGQTPHGKALKMMAGQKYPDYLNRNKRSVWTVTTKPFKGAHFATFPEDLILPCILAGCPKGGVVLDPFAGAGTTGVVCKKNNRNFIGIELNEKYVKMAEQRINNTQESLF